MRVVPSVHVLVSGFWEVQLNSGNQAEGEDDSACFNDTLIYAEMAITAAQVAYYILVAHYILAHDALYV
jgi:hypothetical protein